MIWHQNNTSICSLTVGLLTLFEYRTLSYGARSLIWLVKLLLTRILKLDFLDFQWYRIVLVVLLNRFQVSIAPYSASGFTKPIPSVNGTA
jgi:hypothetical protein